MNHSPPSAEDVAVLLYDLCAELGFCLPPDDQAALCEAPPSDTGLFTDAVFRAEGMDPSLHADLRRQVRDMVAATFKASGPRSRNAP